MSPLSKSNQRAYRGKMAWMGPQGGGFSLDCSDGEEDGCLVPCLPVAWALTCVIIHVPVACLFNFISLTRMSTSLRETSYHVSTPQEFLSVIKVTVQTLDEATDEETFIVWKTALVHVLYISQRHIVKASKVTSDPIE